MKSPQEILDILHDNYRYVKDEKNYGREQMNSHYQEVIEGKDWTDDCDGFAATAAEYLINEGYHRDNIRLVVTKINKLNEMHLVCVLDTNEDTVVFDCNYKSAYSWSSRKNYAWLYAMPLSEPGQWYKLEE